ncbi:hypothetical protein V2A60_005088 [Cordyceps javanica]|uniref:EF-hand calcium-binding domain-containing protein n=1 Tax=Cordyceps javanica TaxID=43265 RepID=A0A545W9V6_9HYPO|nr:EF-hand calcium-binding domain-containing protein [Cordyceps javanica]TQW10696.1 EF-hand calcium-binding domain protein [Cordyceps javanica]
MRILCLHGAYGSAKAFRTQLDPFVSKLEKAGDVSFKFVDGQFPVNPPEGFGDYFGPPPYYRNIDFDGVDGLAKLVNNLRANTEGESYEDTLRSLLKGDGAIPGKETIGKTFDRIKQYLDEDPEIDGILGYSEGATAAASYIFHETQQEEEHGAPRRIKYGIFFAGWPPSKVEEDKVKAVLADECEDMIEVPTCHIVGSQDPYLYGAMSLYGVCNEDNATLFDHGKGHTVPRDNTTIDELVASIRKTIADAGL